MKPKLTSEFDGVVRVADMPLYYSVLPDGRRIIVGSSDSAQLGEIITSDSRNVIKFQDTHGNARTGIDIQKFPDAVATQIQQKRITNLQAYAPWILLTALFTMGLAIFLTSDSNETGKVDFKGALGDLVRK